MPRPAPCPLRRCRAPSRSWTCAGSARVSPGSAEDGGPGIAPERLADVRESFVGGDASRSGRTGGAGLGLIIARAVAQAHVGRLVLALRAEGGLRAEVRLPAGGADGP